MIQTVTPELHSHGRGHRTVLATGLDEVFKVLEELYNNTVIGLIRVCLSPYKMITVSIDTLESLIYPTWHLGRRYPTLCECMYIAAVKSILKHAEELDWFDECHDCNSHERTNSKILSWYDRPSVRVELSMRCVMWRSVPNLEAKQLMIIMAEAMKQMRYEPKSLAEIARKKIRQNLNDDTVIKHLGLPSKLEVFMEKRIMTSCNRPSGHWHVSAVLRCYQDAWLRHMESQAYMHVVFGELWGE